MRNSSRSLIRAVLFAFALAPMSVAAHHGWAGYFSEEASITGTLETPVSLAGPHATLKIRSNGQVWDVVLAPSSRTASAGLKEGLIPLGATVTAHGHRHRDPKKFEIKTERLTWGSRTFNVYPDRT
jgi:hypothetical protein